MLYAGGQIDEHPGIRVEVRDTIGAGDAFAAALTIGMLRGLPLGEINRRAAEVAAAACTHHGALPPGAGA